MLTVGVGCKKQNDVYNPPEAPPAEKKVVVITRADGDILQMILYFM